MPIGAFRLAGLSYTFTDASGTGSTGGRGRTITTNGDAQVDTGRQVFGGGSLLLDGTGDYLNVDLDTSTITGEFTWECWFNVDIDAGEGTVSILSNRTGSFGNGDIMMLFRNYDMKIQVNAGGGTSAFSANGVGSVLAVDTWHHYAFVRDSSNNVGVFVNGTRVANSTWDGTLSTGSFGIGAHADGGIPANSGTSAWIDEVRVSSTNRYDPTQTSITVPSTAFTDDSDTKLLLHMDGADGDTTFSDDDSAASSGAGGAGGGGATGRTAITLTAGGNAKIKTSASKIGGVSAYFDGTGDSVSFGSLGTSYADDFTIEGWLRLSALPSNNSFKMFFGANVGTEYITLKNEGGTYVTSSVLHTGSALHEANYTLPSLATNTWYHLAIVKSGSTLKHFWNGSELTTLKSSSGTMSSAHGYQNLDRIGLYSNGGLGWSGYIDEVRVSDNARYTSDFTPETVQHTNDTNTKLLLHMDGQNNSTVFIDDNGSRQPACITEVFGGEIDTAQYKFGTASWYQDSEYYGLKQGPGAQDRFDAIGTGEFTVEMWVRKDTNTSANQFLFNANFTSSLHYNDVNNRFEYKAGGDTVLRITGSTSISNNTWYHVAISRDSSGNTRMFLNGTQEGSTYADSTNWSTNSEYLYGVSRDGDKSWRGHIDELRVSSIGRYSSTFTPETVEHNNDTDTMILLHFEGADGDTTFSDDNA
tara:strand:- start:45 stop:2141 length:2097 start_codon:yes stop_codon:yes gene_type:complete